MILRPILFAFVAICLIGAAIVFEAASATSLALDAAAKARDSESTVVRQRLLLRGQTLVAESWARPALWHAGAAEALSGIYFLQAQETHDAALFQQSVASASQAVRLGPVQPHAWTRLALLAEAGHPNTVCNIDACLAQSWATARMIDPETACMRLHLAHRRGQLHADDPRIDDYLRSGVSRRMASACLSFLPGDQLFNALARNASLRR